MEHGERKEGIQQSDAGVAKKNGLLNKFLTVSDRKGHLVGFSS